MNPRRPPAPAGKPPTPGKPTPPPDAGRHGRRASACNINTAVPGSPPPTREKPPISNRFANPGTTQRTNNDKPRPTPSVPGHPSSDEQTHLRAKRATTRHRKANAHPPGTTRGNERNANASTGKRPPLPDETAAHPESANPRQRRERNANAPPGSRASANGTARNQPNVEKADYLQTDSPTPALPKGRTMTNPAQTRTRRPADPQRPPAIHHPMNKRTTAVRRKRPAAGKPTSCPLGTTRETSATRTPPPRSDPRCPTRQPHTRNPPTPVGAGAAITAPRTTYPPDAQGERTTRTPRSGKRSHRIPGIRPTRPSPRKTHHPPTGKQPATGEAIPPHAAEWTRRRLPPTDGDARNKRKDKMTAQRNAESRRPPSAADHPSSDE